MSEDLVPKDITATGEVGGADSVEQEAPKVFSHPRGYINEDGKYAIWVGRPPGYEWLDDEEY
jgi:hypothetical protein